MNELFAISVCIVNGYIHGVIITSTECISVAFGTSTIIIILYVCIYTSTQIKHLMLNQYNTVQHSQVDCFLDPTYVHTKINKHNAIMIYVISPSI